jgi:NADH:ubiquinone reductase (non-electrogenic)
MAERTPILVSRPNLTILGSGFGAFSILKEIDGRLYDVVVISPRNHFLFTPLLPSTTVGTVEFRSIIEPIRTARKGIRYYQASCNAIDSAGRTLRCESARDGSPFTVAYDKLVIAVGAAVNTYGIPGVEEHAHFLKEVADARLIRQKIIDCLERASIPGLPEDERRRLLHFIVVGGGPTGVEFAAEMHDFLVEDLRKAFPALMDDVRITLLEAADHILNTFDAALSSYTLIHFRRQRIDVRTGSGVVKVDGDAVHLKDGTSLPYGLLVWSTGNGGAPFVRSLPFRKDQNSRIIIDRFLRVPGQDGVYALGDCATPEERNVPATAQLAQQEGRYLGRSLNALARHKPVMPFRERNFGMLAYVGSNRALADLTSVKSYGYTTWLFWRSIYLTKLISIKNKMLVLFDWFKTILFGRDISRF